MLTALDIVVIIGWLGLTMGLGLWFGRKASTSTNSFFVTDRSLPWWVIGTSMVATTFAADTPLAVSGYVAGAGVAANWKWWWTGIGAVCTTFLFAKLWRRSGVVTDAELAELRYGGTASKVLRGVKAVWFGVFLNVLIIAWVMKAMRKIAEVVLGLSPETMWFGLPAWMVVTLVLFIMAVGYTGVSGMWGVVMTDLPQFALAMAGSVTLAIMAWFKVGGLEGMQAGFAEHDFDWARTTELIPLSDLAPDGAAAELFLLLTVVWWSARNVDGGGYLAQRLFAAKDERHAQWGYLWYTIANLVLRPWPWVIVGLAGMALLGPLDDPEKYYPEMMVALLPAGVFGLMVASFLAAFMSTIDTQLHWGASLLVNDLYRRFLRPKAPDAEHLKASRAAVLLLAGIGAVVSFYLDDIRFAWELALAVTAGLGAVFFARWYWWRVSAWSELGAMGVAAVGTYGFKLLRAHHPESVDTGAWLWLADVPVGWLRFPFDATAIVMVSLPCWLALTYLTAAPEREHLRTFYRKVRPGGPGWKAVAGDIEGFENDGPGWTTLLGIVAGNGLVFGSLLGMGAVFVGRFSELIVYVPMAVLGTVGVIWAVREEALRSPLLVGKVEDEL